MSDRKSYGAKQYGRLKNGGVQTLRRLWELAFMPLLRSLGDWGINAATWDRNFVYLVKRKKLSHIAVDKGGGEVEEVCGGIRL